jgi:glycosyltransferase involved in cell wall biosynthesis
MKSSIIIRCYNTLPLIKKSVEAAIQTTGDDTEIILINNHPPYRDVIEYLQNLNHPRVVVLDPGRNIGNIEGFNYGAKRSRGKNLIILDDDIIVPNNNWLHVMSQSLEDFPNLAYVSLVWPTVKNEISTHTGFRDKIIQKLEYTIQFTNDMVVFGCVMMRKATWQQYFSHIHLTDRHLYAIDANYKVKANELRMKTAYIISHMAEHLGRTQESDLLYGAWKVFYAYALTRADYTEWRKNKTSFTIDEEHSLRNFGYPEIQIEELKKLITTSSF